MTIDNPVHKRLRETAERIAAGKPVALTEEERLELLALTHELEVTQIELETQNQDLLKITRHLETARNEIFDLYETAPVAFVGLSPKGLVERANVAARTLLGADRAQSPLGRGFSQFIAVEDQARFFRAMRRLAATNHLEKFEVRLARQKGDPIEVQIQAAPKRDAEGDLQYWHLAIFDITDMRRRQAELKRVHAQLEMAARAAKLGIWNHDLDAEVNPLGPRAVPPAALEAPERAGEERVFLPIHPSRGPQRHP